MYFSLLNRSSKDFLSFRKCLYWLTKERTTQTRLLASERSLHTSQMSLLLQRPIDICCSRATLPFVCVRQLNGNGRRLKRSSDTRRRREINSLYYEQQRRLPSVAHRVWILRLAHENSYLSWSRNAAICAGIAATVRVFEGQEQFPVSSQSIMTGFSDLGLVFILYGSCHHVYQAYKLRKSLQLTLAEFLWVCAYTSVIGLLYYALIQSKFKVIGNW